MSIVKTPLQKSLVNQYGDAVYLTNENLDWENAIDLTPDVNAEKGLKLAASSGVFNDKILTDIDIKHGSSNTQSLGKTFLRGGFLLPPFNRAHTFNILLKSPNQDIHKIPLQMQPLVPIFQKLINAQYQGSPYATDKLCFAMLRVLPLISKKKQLTEDSLHIHTAGYQNSARYIREMKKFGVNDQTIEAVKMISKNMLFHEGFFSNINGTKFQTEATVEPLRVVKRNTTHKVIREDQPKILTRQAQPWELTVTGGNVYHSASKPTVTEYGHVRLMLNLTYTHTHESEQKFRQEFNVG